MLRHILNTEVLQVIPERKHRQAFSLIFCIKAVVRTVLQHDLQGRSVDTDLRLKLQTTRMGGSKGTGSLSFTKRSSGSVRYFRAPSRFVTFGWPKVIACPSLNPSSFSNMRTMTAAAPPKLCPVTRVS